jgi:hypothetical protein
MHYPSYPPKAPFPRNVRELKKHNWTTVPHPALGDQLEDIEHAAIIKALEQTATTRRPPPNCWA